MGEILRFCKETNALRYKASQIFMSHWWRSKLQNCQEPFQNMAWTQLKAEFQLKSTAGIQTFSNCPCRAREHCRHPDFKWRNLRYFFYQPEGWKIFEILQKDQCNKKENFSNFYATLASLKNLVGNPFKNGRKHVKKLNFSQRALPASIFHPVKLSFFFHLTKNPTFFSNFQTKPTQAKR